MFRRILGLVTSTFVAAGLVLSSAVPSQATPAGVNLSWLGSTPAQTTASLLGLAAGGTTPTVDIASTLNTDFGPGLATDGTYLYYAYMGNIVKSYSDGTSRTTVLANFASTAIGSSISALAANGGNLYILGTTSGSGVFRVPTIGGSLTRIDTAPFSPVSILPGASGLGVVGSNLYWTESTGIKSAPVAGGSETLFAANSVFNNSQTALGLTTSGTLVIASATNGMGPGSFYLYDTSASSPSWREVQQASFFSDGGNFYFSPNYPNGMTYDAGTIYYTGGNGDLLSITTSLSPTQTMVYLDSNANWAWGVVLAPPVPAPNHTVTFNHGTGGSGNDYTRTASAATALSANTFSRNGYSFSGWNTAANGSGTAYAGGANYSFGADVTLYAQWSANSHTVTFNTGGGSSVADGSFNTDGSLTLPAAPTRSGYTFDGWFPAATGGSALTSPYSPAGTSDITLYAHWTANNSGGGGSNGGGSMPNTGQSFGFAPAFAFALLLGGAALTLIRRRRSS